MTELLSITARPDAPVACDLTEAEDTLAQRLAEYRRLFEHALLGRESTATATTFRLADRPGVREWVLDLVRREAACCPFLSYTVDQVDGELVWTVSGGVGAAEMSMLDELLAEPASATETSDDVAQRLMDRDGVPVIVRRFR